MRNALGVIAAATITVLVSSAGWSQSPVGYKSTVVMQSTKTNIGQDFQYPLLRPQITVTFVEIAPGGQTGRHMHPVPISTYVLEGTLTMAIEGQGEKVFPAGQAFVEPMNAWHNSTNRGTTPIKLLAVAVGEEGKPSRINP